MFLKLFVLQTEDEWNVKAKEFLDQWQYPFGVGAIDGKHVVVILSFIANL